MGTQKRFYSDAQDRKGLVHLDIVGFSTLTEKIADPSSDAAVTFTLFENAVLRFRESMKQCAPAYPQFVREVPVDKQLNGHRYGWWYKEVPQGAVNFIYLSDTVILYSSSLTHLFRETSGIMGAALAYGVPIRGAVTLGDLHHSEWLDRPGSAICLYGSALTRAAHMDKTVLKKRALRIALDSEVVALMQSIPGLAGMVQQATSVTPFDQLCWWQGAFVPGALGSESDTLKNFYERWFTEHSTKDWFSGPNKADADMAVEEAFQALKNLGR